MKSAEQIPLSALTTFKVGGLAREVIECESIDEIKTAVALARDRGLPWRILGGGSNVLASDTGYEGVLIRFKPEKAEGIHFEEAEDATTLLIANAGVIWDDCVRTAAGESLWGIENLGGIPGSVGAAPIQNIGAYGTEVKDTIRWVEVFDTNTLTFEKITNADCGFAYRESVFKHDPTRIITRVAFRLQPNGSAKTEYKDIANKVAEGADVSTPEAVGELVRSIRSQKFPNLSVCGTAGSFFKNPIISLEAYEALRQKYPELPGFSAGANMKVSLAWILDNVLQLRGYTSGHVRLFERQPLVLVAEQGATAEEIDLFARDIEARVLDATDISIEREVQTL